MTYDTYLHHRESIALSNASVEHKEKAIVALDEKFSSTLDRAMQIIQESQPDYSDIGEHDY